MSHPPQNDDASSIMKLNQTWARIRTRTVSKWVAFKKTVKSSQSKINADRCEVLQDKIGKLLSRFSSWTET